jgi:hypothetical protein
VKSFNQRQSAVQTFFASGMDIFKLMQRSQTVTSELVKGRAVRLSLRQELERALLASGHARQAVCFKLIFMTNLKQFTNIG